MNNYVLGLVFNEDNSVVLLQKKANPDWQKNRYNGIGGKLERGETTTQCMNRECKEELGAGTIWVPKFVMAVAQDTMIAVFKSNATKLWMDNALAFAAHTEEECMLTAINNLPENMLTNLRWMIPLLADEKFSAAPLIAMTERS